MPRSSESRFRYEAERLRPLVDAQPILAHTSIAAYLGTLGCVHHVAHHGVSRPMVPNEAPDRLRDQRDPQNRASVKGSKKITGEYATGLSKPIGESKPPRYDERAQKLLKAELRHLKQREETLLKKLDEIVGER